MNTPKRLFSGSDEASEYSTPTTKRRSRSPSQNLTTPIDHQIEQVARRHRVPSDTVKRIVSDLLTEPTVVDYLRTTLNQSTQFRPDESILSSTSYYDNSTERNFSMPSFFSSEHQSHGGHLATNPMVDECDPLWLEFLQSLNSTELNHQTQINQTQSTVNLDSLLNDDEDDEEFVGPEDDPLIDQTDPKKLKVSKRELALLLKESAASPDELISQNDDDLLPGDQYESLWTEFLASLQRENPNSVDEQPKSIITTTTDDDETEDDPEFRLPDADYDPEDDLEEEIHVSKRELALLLQDNASILQPDEIPVTDGFGNPDSVSSSMMTSSSISSKPTDHPLTRDQRDIIQYQLSAYVQLLTQYILLRRETDPLSVNCQSAQQLFKDLIYFRDKQTNSILSIPLLREVQHLIESPLASSRRKAFGNHLPFHLMDTFCKSPAFIYDSLLPTCLLSSSLSEQNRKFVSGEDCLIALGLEQNDANLLIVGHDEKSIRERINSLRYVRVRRGKQNPIRAFYIYGSVPDVCLAPWYKVPMDVDHRIIYPNGLISKSNVVFPPWFRLSYKRSRQLTKNAPSSSARTNSTNDSVTDHQDQPSSSTVYVVVEGSTPTTRTTSPKKVLQQIHMLHLLNSYPKLQPRQSSSTKN